MTKWKKMCNMFHPLEGYHQSKVMFLMMELCVCRRERERYKNISVSYNYTPTRNAGDVGILKF